MEQMRSMRGNRFGLRTASLALALILAACVTPGEQDPLAPAAEGDGVDFGAYVAGRFAGDTRDPRAADFMLRAARQDPSNPVIMSRAFLALLTEGRIREAVRVAGALHEQNAGNSLAELLLTLDAFTRGDQKQALVYHGGLVASGFETLIAPVLAAWIHASAGDMRAAMMALSPLDRSSALRPFANAHRAFILDYLGEVEGAKEAYRMALEGTQISSLQPIVAYAALLQRNGESAAALTLLDQYRVAFPGNAFLGSAREQLVAGEEVQAVTRTPEGAVSLILFRAAGELDRDEERRPAIVYARLATMLSPDMPDALLRLAGLLADAEHYESALDTLAKIGKDSPEFDTARLQAAWIHQQAGDVDAAIGALEEFLRLAPDNVRAWSTLGDVYRVEERWRDAAQAYTRALALPVENSGVEPWFLHFTRGIAYERMDQWELAEADLLAALDFNPDQAQVLNYLGYSWIDRGMNLERGTAMIEKAVSLRPEDGFIIDSLGWAYYLRGEYDEAVRHLERAVLLEPTDPTLSDHLGDAYWKIGRYREARFQWNHALAIGPDKEEDRVRIAEKIDYGLELADAGGKT